MRKIPLFTATLALCGCTMIPPYLRPGAPVASRFPGGSGKSGASADIRWKEFFTDPRLKRCIEIALENNRDLRVALLNVEQARAQYRISRADLFPRVSATGSFTRSRSPGGLAGVASTGTAAAGSASTAEAAGLSSASTSVLASAGTTTSIYSVNVGTTAWELDLFGRVRSLNRRALESYLASDETRRSTEISLVAQVATQYLVLREQEEQLDLARQTLVAVQKSYDLNKKTFDVGTASELDLSIAEAQVQTASVNVINFERLNAQAANYLSLLIGQPLPANLPAGRSLSHQGILANISSGLPSDLIARRPDILAAEHTLLAANASIGAARAAFFPVISLTTSGGSTSTELSKLFTKPAQAWSFSPQISIPIFTGGSNLANLDVAKISKRIEIANYEKTIQTAFREVADALVGRATYTREIASQQALVAAQQHRYGLSDMLYRSGADTYLSVLLAQQDLYAAQRDLVSIQADRLGNLITLYKSLGGGWQ